MHSPIVLSSVLSSDYIKTLTDTVHDGIPADLRHTDINPYDMNRLVQNRGKDGKRLCETMMNIFSSSRCHKIARSMLKDDMVFLYPNCAFRFHQPEDYHSYLPLHLDAEFMGHDIMSLNFWVPLVDVGIKAPGLTFVDPDLDPNIYLKPWLSTTLTGGRKRFAAEELAELYHKPVSDILFTPVVPAGSVALFHQLTLHATQMLPGGGDYRVSIEFRVGARSKLPRTYYERELEVATPRKTLSGWTFDYQNARDLRGATA